MNPILGFRSYETLCVPWKEKIPWNGLRMILLTLQSDVNSMVALSVLWSSCLTSEQEYREMWVWFPLGTMVFFSCEVCHQTWLGSGEMWDWFLLRTAFFFSSEVCRRAWLGSREMWDWFPFGAAFFFLCEVCVESLVTQCETVKCAFIHLFK